MDIKNELIWSTSRISLFNQCKRKYYYNHYAFWGGWLSNATADQKEIYLLKNLRSFSLVVGGVVHEVIDQALKKYVAGSSIQFDYLESEFNRKYDFIIRLSQGGMYKRKPNLGGISEYEYELRVSDDLIEETRVQGLSYLKSFFQSTMLKRIMKSDRTKWMFPEKFLTYHLGTERAYAVFDFAFIEGDSVIIVDFKTGTQRTEYKKDDQVMAYSHYFWKEKKYAPENIQFIFWDLNKDELHTFKFTKDDFISFEEKVANDLVSLREPLTDVAENIAVVENFPKTEIVEYCRECNFRRYCS